MQLQKKQKEKEYLKSTLGDISDNLNIMKKHLANVQNQLNINQNLIYAHNNQKTAEENLVKLAQIEDSSLLNDIKRVKKELENTIERQKSVQVITKIWLTYF